MYRRIDGYNAYGELQAASTLLRTQIERGNGDASLLAELLAEREEARGVAVTLEREVAALRADRAQTPATTEASEPVGTVASTNPATAR